MVKCFEPCDHIATQKVNIEGERMEKNMMLPIVTIGFKNSQADLSFSLRNGV